MKRLIILICIFSFSATTHAQQSADTATWFVKMKRELNLTQEQERQIKKIDYGTQIKILGVSQSHTSYKAKQKKIDAINSDRKRMIMKILNKDQRERWQMILDNTPRRGVTDMPNERIAK